MTEHIKEPWPEFRQHIGAGSLTEADYERARLCVNACEGMDDPAHEISSIKSYIHLLTDRMLEAEKQRDELLEAAKDYMANQTASNSEKSCGHDFYCICSQDRLNKAIKNAGAE